MKSIIKYILITVAIIVAIPLFFFWGIVTILRPNRSDHPSIFNTILLMIVAYWLGTKTKEELKEMIDKLLQR